MFGIKISFDSTTASELSSDVKQLTKLIRKESKRTYLRHKVRSLHDAVEELEGMDNERELTKLEQDLINQQISAMKAEFMKQPSNQ